MHQGIHQRQGFALRCNRIAGLLHQARDERRMIAGIGTIEATNMRTQGCFMDDGKALQEERYQRITEIPSPHAAPGYRGL
jgi:hypothetical protein